MDKETKSSLITLSPEKRKFVINHVHAFVNEEGNCGNPAGVVVLNPNVEFSLENQIMINVAKQVGYPETAFVQICDDTSSTFDVDVRFATPISANGFCGHATIATFGFLIANKLIRCNSVVKMRTTVLGENGNNPQLTMMEITCTKNFIEMEQKLPIFHTVQDVSTMKDIISRSLNLPITSFFETIEIVNTGGKDAILALKEKSVLDNVKLTQEICQMISEVSKNYNIVGYHLFPLNSLIYDTKPDDSNTVSVTVRGVRNFAPLEGIPEEAATGSACGAMACFIVRHILIPKFKAKPFAIDNNNMSIKFAFEQGRIFGYPSDIFSHILYDMSKNKFISVKVSGRFQEKPDKRSIIVL